MYSKFIRSIFCLLLLIGGPSVKLFSQSNQIQMEVIKNELNFDAQFLTEYLVWGDTKMVSILEKLNEEEFNHDFNELSGNIRSKTAHILSVYEFFIKIIEGNPYQTFPDLGHLTRDELIEKWWDVIDKWPDLVRKNPNGLYALPLAGDQRVDVGHIYFDAMIHTIHHRAQLLTFFRLLEKSKEDIHPRDTNADYLMYLFQEKNEYIYPALGH